MDSLLLDSIPNKIILETQSFPLIASALSQFSAQNNEFRDVQVFTTNETGWTAIKGSVSTNILTITAQESDCADTISWMVIGERQDPDIKSSALTDDEGNLIVERPNSEDPAHISQAAIDKQQTVYENGGL